MYYYLTKDELDQRYNSTLVFWLEAIAIWAFGFSWIVKGGALAADPNS